MDTIDFDEPNKEEKEEQDHANKASRERETHQREQIGKEIAHQGEDGDQYDLFHYLHMRNYIGLVLLLLEGIILISLYFI